VTTAHKRDRHGFRGLPPPPVFDFDALPDGAMLNEYETAAVGRWSTNTLSAWRLREGQHGLRWVVIAGGFIRYRVSAIRAFLATPRRASASWRRANRDRERRRMLCQPPRSRHDDDSAN
jgi:hypothetical protein